MTTYVRERFNASRRPKYSDDDLRAEFQRVQRGIPYPIGADVRDFGARGTFDASELAGPDDTAALNRAFAVGGTIVLQPDAHYKTTGVLDLSNVTTLIANGAAIHRTDVVEEQAGEICSSVGTVGTYRNLAADADRGTNILESSTLADEVSPGDVIKITGDELFVTSGGSGLFQGEMHTVRAVDGDNVYLNTTLFDTYTTANTARAAKVTPTSLHIIGGLTLWRHPTTLLQDLYGIRFQYAANVRGSLVCYNCQERSVAVNSCFDVKLDVSAFNSDAGSGSLGYGVSVNDSSMFCEFNVNIHAAKHCVAIGGSPANRGVAWEITFRGTGTSASGAEVFDAHNEAGSVAFEDLHAIGGSWDDGDGTVTSAVVGINSGARYTRIRNFTAERCSTAVKTRIGGATAKEFDIDGVRCIGCTGNGFWHADSEATIEKLRVRNISGVIGSGANPNHAVKIAGSVSQEILDISDVNMDVGGLLSISAGLSDVPAIVRLANCSTSDPTPATSTEDTDWKCIQLGSTLITEAHLINCRVAKQGYGIYVENGITLTVLSFNGCHFEDNHLHVRFGASAAASKVVSYNSHFLRDKSEADPRGVLHHPASGDVIALLELIGTTVDTSPYFLRGTATTILLGPNNLPAVATPFAISEALSSGWLEILSGSINDPKVVRGNGSPDTVVTASAGSIFQRADGSAATLLYVNTDGATAWTAFA